MKIKQCLGFCSLFLLNNALMALPFANLSFEDGLTGWTAQGNVFTSSSLLSLPKVNASVEYTATDGHYFAQLNTNGTEDKPAVDTSEFSGTFGSILSTDLVLTKGETFQFDWAFLTFDQFAPDPSYNDFFIFVGGQKYLLADAVSIGDERNSGWQTFSWQAKQDFDGKLLFVASDYNDTIGNSSVLIDNIAITSGYIAPIPSPTPFPLIGLGLVAITLFRKNNRKFTE